MAETLTENAPQEPDMDIPEAVTSDAGDAPETEVSEVTETTQDILDVDAYGDQLVPLIVDGEEILKPLREVAAEGMMQSKFTKEMQTLREKERQYENYIRVGEALQTDPEGTLRMLNAQMGWNQPNQQAASEEEEFLSDEEKAIRHTQAELEEVKNRLAVAEQQRQLEKEFADLEAAVGPVDRDELVKYADSAGIYNLRAAYADMNLDLIQKGKTVSQSESAKQRVLAEKRDAQVVSRGGQAQAAGSGGDVVETPSDVREAIALAGEGKEVEFRMPSWIKQV